MSELAGTGALVRLILRRDRFILPVWILIPAALAWASGVSFTQLYQTPKARQAYVAEVANNPAVVALLGPVFASSIGALVAWRWTIQGVFFAGLGSLLIVIRHTRADEQAGRRELVGSSVVGRHAPLTAALLATFGADLAIALLVAGGLTGLGLPAPGSLALGVTVAAVGCTVAAAAAMFAQVTQGAGAARGLAGIFLGAAYLLRLDGDLSASAGGGPDWTSWISPIGWARFTRPFAGEQWWVFGLFSAAIVCLTASAYVLSGRRDLGAGLLPESAGPPAAGRMLSGPFGLAWRLQWSALAAWTACFAVLGVAFGFVVRTVSEMLIADQAVADFLASISNRASATDVVFHLYMLTFGPLIALYAVHAAQRARSEEVEQRAEPVLAAAVPRARWLSSHLVFAALGPVLVLSVLGLAAGFTYGSSMDNVAGQVGRVLAATLVYLPAVWVIAGIAALQVGMLPRLAFLGWAAWLLFAIIDFAHERELVSDWVYAISPFAHVPKLLLGDPVVIAPMIALLALAALLTSLGLIGFSRRDVG